MGKLENGGEPESSVPEVDASAGIIECVHVHAQTWALYFARPDRGVRIAADKQADDVRASGNRREVHVTLDLAVDVLETFCGQR